MAKQPGSPSGGSGDSAAESRPISVSELLARRDAAIADEEREKRAEGRGRRRAGRDGSVSVSELTGEIPRITDAPTSPTTSDAAEHFPRSSSPVPRRASDSRPLQDSADPAGSAESCSGRLSEARRGTGLDDRGKCSAASDVVGDVGASVMRGISPVSSDTDTEPSRPARRLPRPSARFSRSSSAMAASRRARSSDTEIGRDSAAESPDPPEGDPGCLAIEIRSPSSPSS